MNDDELNRRIAEVEKNLAIFSAGEKNRIQKLERIDRTINGYNGIPGIAYDVHDMKKFKDKFVKVVLWVTILIIAPLFGSIGYLTVKILAHIDTIIKILDKLQ
jgi:hypothetical protein